MGDVHQNQLTPEGQQSMSSSSANYSKAYSSFSPVIPQTINENAAKEQAKREEEEMKKRELYNKVVGVLDDLVEAVDKADKEMDKTVERRNKASRVFSIPFLFRGVRTSTLTESSTGIQLEAYGVYVILKEAKKDLLAAKKTGDPMVMAQAVAEYSPYIGLFGSYMYMYKENMESSASNWIKWLERTKVTSFAIVSAYMANLYGGTLLASTLSGAGFAASDALLTEAAMYDNGLSGGLGAATKNVILKTVSGGAFGFAGGLLGKVPILKDALGSSDEYISLISGTGANLGLGVVESKAWDAFT